MKAVAAGKGFPRKRNGQRAGTEQRRGWEVPWRHDPAKIISVAISPAKIISFHGLPFLEREGVRGISGREEGEGRLLVSHLLSYLKF